MALLDFLKRKTDNKKARESSVKEKKPRKKPAKVSSTKEEIKEKPQAPKEAVFQKISKKVSDFSYNTVREPHISEKATNLAEKNQYIFKVSENFNKKEIKKAVEGVYGVNVLSVNVIKIPAKKRRIGRIQGHKKGYTKAVVKIREGQKIEIL